MTIDQATRCKLCKFMNPKWKDNEDRPQHCYRYEQMPTPKCYYFESRSVIKKVISKAIKAKSGIKK